MLTCIRKQNLQPLQDLHLLLCPRMPTTQHKRPQPQQQTCPRILSLSVSLELTVRRSVFSQTRILSDANADPCGVQPDGFGPRPETDSVEAFLAYQPFADAANAAAANPPSGYTTVFKNLQGSVSANTYLGLTTLTKYDAALCQQLCDSKDLCTGFNVSLRFTRILSNRSL